MDFKVWRNFLDGQIVNGPLLLGREKANRPLISLEFLKLLLQDFFSFFSVNHSLATNCRFPYFYLVDNHNVHHRLNLSSPNHSLKLAFQFSHKSCDNTKQGSETISVLLHWETLFDNWNAAHENLLWFHTVNHIQSPVWKITWK